MVGGVHPFLHGEAGIQNIGGEQILALPLIMEAVIAENAVEHPAVRAGVGPVFRGFARPRLCQSLEHRSVGQRLQSVHGAFFIDKPGNLLRLVGVAAAGGGQRGSHCHRNLGGGALVSVELCADRQGAAAFPVGADRQGAIRADRCGESF